MCLKKARSNEIRAGNDAKSDLSKQSMLFGRSHGPGTVDEPASKDSKVTSSSWHGPVPSRTTTSTRSQRPVRSDPMSDNEDSPSSTSTSKDGGAPVLSRITSSDRKPRTSSTDEWNGPTLGLTEEPTSVSITATDSSQSGSQDMPAPSTLSSFTTDAPPPTGTGGQPVETGVQQDKLSNGATAGIVIAAMTVLMGAIVLGRYLYKKRKREKQSRWGDDDSSGIGPYRSDSRHGQPAPAPIPPPPIFEQDERGDDSPHPPDWLQRNRASRIRASRSWSGSPSPTPVLGQNVELRSFTRPSRPKLFEIGNPVSSSGGRAASFKDHHAEPGPQPH